MESLSTDSKVYLLIPIRELSERLSTDLKILSIALNLLIVELRECDPDGFSTSYWDEVLLWGGWEINDIHRHISKESYDERVDGGDIMNKLPVLITGLAKYASQVSSIPALLEIFLAKKLAYSQKQQKELKSLQSKKAPLIKKSKNQQYDMDTLKPYFEIYYSCSIDPPTATGFWRGIKKLKNTEAAERDWCMECLSLGVPINQNGRSLGEVRVKSAFTHLLMKK